MLVTGTEACIQEFETGLIARFGKDGVSSFIGDEIDFLGMRVSRNPTNNDITLTQMGYIESIFEEDHLQTEDKKVSSPHYSNFSADKSKDSSPLDENKEYFRRKVMQVMYAAVRTRPDVIFDTVVLAGRCENPTEKDMASLRRILIFLYQTRTDGLRFKSAGKFKPNASVDASFNCYENGRGHSGFAMFLDLEGSAAILYKSIKQLTVSNSSTEAELISLKEAVMHILWAARMCQELDPELNIYPITIYNDNKSLISLVNQPIVNRQGRSKFINRSMFQVNENIADGEVVVVYQDTNSLVADFLTKALHGERYRNIRAEIMGLDGKTIEIHLGDGDGTNFNAQASKIIKLKDHLICLLADNNF